jgi:hypothetical protein
MFLPFAMSRNGGCCAFERGALLFFEGVLWGLQGRIVLGSEAVLVTLCGWAVFFV